MGYKPASRDGLGRTPFTILGQCTALETGQPVEHRQGSIVPNAREFELNEFHKCACRLLNGIYYSRATRPEIVCHFGSV